MDMETEFGGDGRIEEGTAYEELRKLYDEGMNTPGGGE